MQQRLINVFKGFGGWKVLHKGEIKLFSELAATEGSNYVAFKS